MADLGVKGQLCFQGPWLVDMTLWELDATASAFRPDVLGRSQFCTAGSRSQQVYHTEDRRSELETRQFHSYDLILTDEQTFTTVDYTLTHHRAKQFNPCEGKNDTVSILLSFYGHVLGCCTLVTPSGHLTYYNSKLLWATYGPWGCLLRPFSPFGEEKKSVTYILDVSKNKCK